MPRRIVAQQLLAVCLQKHSIGRRLWADEWNGLPPIDASRSAPNSPTRCAISWTRWARLSGLPP
jgi:hypothetical protein